MLKTLTKILLFYSISTIKTNTLICQIANCQGRLDTIKNEVLTNLPDPERNELLSCIYLIQNRGFSFEENECNYDSAKHYIEKALSIWRQVSDTINQANLLKYLGYLNGKLGNFLLAKKQIEMALVLYYNKNNIPGVAVSLLNLAKVHEYENNFLLAINYTKDSYRMWKLRNDTTRLMLTNNHLIHLYSITASNISIKKILTENINYLSNFHIYWLQELDFYYAVYEYFKSRKFDVKAAKYMKLYQNKIQNIKESNQVTKYSIYDPEKCR